MVDSTAPPCGFTFPLFVDLGDAAQSHDGPGRSRPPAFAPRLPPPFSPFPHTLERTLAGVKEGRLFASTMRPPLKLLVVLLPRCCWVAGYHVAPLPTAVRETSSSRAQPRSVASFHQQSQRRGIIPLAMSLQEEEDEIKEGPYLSLTKLTREQVGVPGSF